jgi:phosphoserine phosphatase RsbU/P
MRILLAEDSSRSGNQIQFLLERAGHTVLHVVSGKQAIACHEADPFPVIIADLKFPDLDGFELCRQVRERVRSEYVYIILLIPPGPDFPFDQAAAAEVDDVLFLPVNADILRARLRVATRMFDLYQELDTLRGFIPICTHCKKIRQEQGLWQQMETYISSHSHARFSHTVCPECALRELEQRPAQRP